MHDTDSNHVTSCAVPSQSLNFLRTPLQQGMPSEHCRNKHHMCTLDDALCFQPAATINGSKAAALVDHLIRSKAELPEHGNLSALYGSGGAACIYFCIWRLLLNENLNYVHLLKSATVREIKKIFNKKAPQRSSWLLEAQASHRRNSEEFNFLAHAAETCHRDSWLRV